MRRTGGWLCAGWQAGGGRLFGFGTKYEEKPAEPKLHAARIEDYAVIGDLQTAALVSREGSIDWLCWPNFSSGACFAALLGTKENGFWKIAPLAEKCEITRKYREHTMILETTFKTDEGEVVLTDFMPPRGKYSDVIRRVRGVRGKVKMRMELMLRFDYGLTIPWVTQHDRELRAIAGPNMVVLRSECAKGATAEFEGEGMATVSEFTLKEGREVCFTMTYAPSNEDVPPKVRIDKEQEDTEQYWCKWASQVKYTGAYTRVVERSLLTLKTLSFEPTGGVVAAVTTSLPERLGGERNWDYRYCWLRDTAFTLLVLMLAGYTDEAQQWRLWLLRAIAGAPDQVQSLYSIYGERKLPEWEASWLPGYEGSKPVRIGNAAAEQFQLDVFGEVAVALSRMPDAVEDLRVPARDLQANLIDHVCQVWDQPDEGIWEVRGGRKHFVHSKAMAWAALDRGIKQHEKYDGKGDVKRWRKNRDRLHQEICERGFSKKLNSFTQTYDSELLDASSLRLAFIGFLPMDDPRMIGTIEAVEKHLMPNGLVERYDVTASPDGLKGSEGTFLACSFWLVNCLHLIGQREKARSLFEKLIGLCNDVGLLSEEYDAKENRMLGNFPQALSHIALIHAAFTIDDQWKPNTHLVDE